MNGVVIVFQGGLTMRRICATTVLVALTILNSDFVRAEMLYFTMTVSLPSLQGQATLVAEEKETPTEPAPSGDIEERGIRRFGAPTAPGTVVQPPPKTPRPPFVFAPLTIKECVSLGGVVDNSDEGCKAKNQFTCRTSGGVACIDEVSPQ